MSQGCNFRHGSSWLLAAGYSCCLFSGAKSIVNAAPTTKQPLAALTKSNYTSFPTPNKALSWLKSTATSDIAFIPNVKSYVVDAFKNPEKIQAKYGDKVNKIGKQT
jgi:hypothetical protein